MKNFKYWQRLEIEKPLEQEFYIALNPIKSPSYHHNRNFVREGGHLPVCAVKWHNSPQASLVIVSHTNFNRDEPFRTLTIKINGEFDGSADFSAPHYLYSLGCNLREFVADPYQYLLQSGIPFCNHTKYYAGWRGEKLLE